MQVPVIERIAGALLPDTKLVWEQDGNLIDFSVSHSYSVEIEPWAGGALSFAAKTSGITGAATSPNVTIAWSSGEIDSLTLGSYRVEITATRSSDSKPRKRQWRLEIVSQVS
jgi:hypothetical protein